MKSPRFPPAAYDDGASKAEEGFAGTRFVEARSNAVLNSKPFTLQPPPIKIQSATPSVPQDGFAPAPPAPPAPKRDSKPPAPRRLSHVAAAPGEQTYDAVPIPGAYAQHSKFGGS